MTGCEVALAGGIAKENQDAVDEIISNYERVLANAAYRRMLRYPSGRPGGTARTSGAARAVSPR